MNTKLYRLKSNKTTIVQRMKNSNSQKIVWSRTMEEYGVDNSWMISRFNPDNVIELTPKESKEVKDKINKFKKRL